MAEPPRRIDIGFQGGQVLPVRVTQEVLDEFRKALSNSVSDRWFDLHTQDCDVHIDQSQVPFLGQHGRDGEQPQRRRGYLFANELERMFKAPERVWKLGIYQ